MKKNSLFFIVVLMTTTCYSQEFQAKITVNSSRIPTTVDKKIFTTLQNQLTSFFNTRKWTDDAYKTTEKIDVNIPFYNNGKLLNIAINQNDTNNSRKIKNVNINFINLGNNVYGFNNANNLTLKSDEKLVIDPVPNVLWSSYFGNGGTDWLTSSCLDVSRWKPPVREPGPLSKFLT